MKKLIFFIPAIIIALIMLIFVVKFAGRILNTVPINQGETETNLPLQNNNQINEKDNNLDIIQETVLEDDEGEEAIDYSEEDLQIPEPVVDLEDSQVNGSKGLAISFKDVNELVTAKELTNLRDIPSTDNGSKVVDVLYYGDMATRTGIGDNGWSRVEYKDKTLYAVTNYLTTNLDYHDNILKPTLEDPEAGIDFTEVNQLVTAKIITNLRLIPSSDSDDTIVVTLENGQIARRTGLGSNAWSRVEYEGQILYAVTNYLEIVEEE